MSKATSFFECRFCGVVYAEPEPFERHESRCEQRPESPPATIDPLAGREDLIADPDILSRRFEPQF